MAYSNDVKHDLLEVRPGPVVSEEATRDLASGAAQTLGADIGLALTGVGGPDPQDGIPPGTVWMAVAANGQVLTRKARFHGDPSEVCQQSCQAVLLLPLEQLRAGPGG